jgi:protein-S-isoprenylcysteine O-methyltransferase Ste14
MLDFLNHINAEDFQLLIYAWVIINLLTGLPIFIGKMMPMSGRSGKTPLSIMGDINKKAAWIIMEIPVLIVVIAFYAMAEQPMNYSVIMVGAFCLHYCNRALVYPHRIKADGKTMPVMIMLFSMIFYTVHGYMIGHYFGALKSYSVEWLLDPRFIIGATMFLAGLCINIYSDNILLNLRKPGETGYKIPRGGLFKYVSSPHYLGEMIEWTGFAIMTWSLPGFAYALTVVVPLFGQALNAHQWYLSKFADDYPKSRKAIFPGIL